MTKRGRPTIFKKTIAREICRRIADGASLRSICQDDDLPHRDTVRRWLRRKPDFRADYADARIYQAEHYIDEIVEIADTDDNPSRARVRIDARKWVAARLAPKKYSERSEIELSGGIDIANRLERARERIEDEDE